MFKYTQELLKNNLFNGFTEFDIKKLIEFDHCIIEKYPNKTLIIQEHDKCKSLGFVIEGSLATQQFSSIGDNITLKILKKGDSFGEALLFSSDSEYRFNLMTTSNTVVIYIPFDQIKKMLTESIKFSTNYIVFLSDMASTFHVKIKILSQKDVRTKLIIYLSKESKKFNKLSFAFAHSKTEIADLIGAARPSVSREFQRMQQDQLLKYDRKSVTILKPEMFCY
ncbi:MAG: Crp/Fnr family transcriptional regulator [Clostridiaceae bacterium]